MYVVWNDVRYALRMLARSPGSTAVALFALALGIGANTAIFSVVNGVLLRPLPYPQPDRLAILWETQPSKGIRDFPASPPDYRDWLDRSRSFEQIAAFREHPSVLTGGALPERLDAASLTPACFQLLGAQAQHGRLFLPEEDQPGHNHVAVLSYGLWQRRFGGDTGIVGRSLDLDGGSYSIVGVMSPGFKLLDTTSEIWVPYTLDSKELSEENRGYKTLRVIARLRSGVTLEQAAAEMQSIAAVIEHQHADVNGGWSATATLLREQLVGDTRPTLYTLIGAVAFVLLIACSNVANLLLVRASARQKEIAIRAALGASHWRIIRQVMSESLLLSLTGAALGLVLARLALPVLLRLSPGNIPRGDEITLDLRVMAFTFAVSIAAALISGSVPAIIAVRAQLNEVLKAAGRTSMASVRTRRLRNFLVVSQVAFSVALLIGAGLMIRSLLLLQSVNPGFRTDHVITMQLALPDTRYEGLHVAQFYRQLLDRLQPLPVLQYAAVARNLPLGGGDNSLNFEIANRPAQASGDQPRARYRAVSSDYFSALGIPLIKGRCFQPSDSEASQSVVIINDLMARRFWPNDDPIGRRMKAGFSEAPWSTIIGVVGNVKWAGLDAETNPEMYYSFQQVPPTLMSFVEGSMAVILRTHGDPSSVIKSVREQAHALDPDQPVFRVRTMEDLVHGSVAKPRFRATLVTIFAAVALALAVVGLYGVISYSVSQRSNEMGVRAALGAGKRDLLQLVLGEGTRLALAGVLIGLAIGYPLARSVQRLLYGVRAYDPITFLAIPLLLLVVALLATAVPALRATRTDPSAALRYE
ncbi:MAG TPA: ABC transporter permease [Bryobacteraceae bacterium]|nr:ABC transporter permease [Bryobacteraceae bacterium]